MEIKFQYLYDVVILKSLQNIANNQKITVKELITRQISGQVGKMLSRGFEKVFDFDFDNVNSRGQVIIEDSFTLISKDDTELILRKLRMIKEGYSFENSELVRNIRDLIEKNYFELPGNVVYEKEKVASEG